MKPDELRAYTEALKHIGELKRETKNLREARLLPLVVEAEDGWHSPKLLYSLVRDLAAIGVPVTVTCRVLGFS